MASGVTLATASNAPQARASSRLENFLSILCLVQKRSRWSETTSTPQTNCTPSIEAKFSAWRFAMLPVPRIARRICSILDENEDTQHGLHQSQQEWKGTATTEMFRSVEWCGATR